MAGAAETPIGPRIDPVPAGVPRPRWSVMIPAYNCAATLPATVESVLAQDADAGDMEIVVVDDASSDDVAGVVARYGGRVALHRQALNLGVPENLTACVRLSHGELVHILHGDDAVLPGFYAAMSRAFSDATVGAAFCRQIFTDAAGKRLDLSPLEQPESGVLRDALLLLAAEQRVMTPSICVRRTVYEQLGGFRPELHCAEDWEMWARIAARFPIWYEVEALALYRMQSASNTGRHQRSGADIDYTIRAIDIISGYLPADRAEATARAARATYARSALLIAEQAAARGDFETARAQLKGALRLSRSAGVLAAALVSTARVGVSALRGSRPATASST